MNCQQVREQLADYSAGFVQGDRRQRVKAHLSECEMCRERLAEYRELDRLLGNDRLEAGEALVQGVMARVRAEPAPVRRPWLDRLESLGPALAWASVVSCAMLVLYAHLVEWLELVGPLTIDWSFLAQPTAAMLFVAGAVLVAGAVTLAANRLAEALT
ncbi:MAG: anti-sigma factor family protein [Armatimonadota bacterium]